MLTPTLQLVKTDSVVIDESSKKNTDSVVMDEESTKKRKVFSYVLSLSKNHSKQDEVDDSAAKRMKVTEILKVFLTYPKA